MSEIIVSKCSYTYTHQHIKDITNKTIQKLQGLSHLITTVFKKYFYIIII